MEDNLKLYQDIANRTDGDTFMLVLLDLLELANLLLLKILWTY